MIDEQTYTATGCSYASNGNWANSKQKNPLYVGSNSSGSTKYIAQLIFPKIDSGKITKMELSVYRTSSNATNSKTQYYGCSSSLTDYGSVLSTGKTVEITGGEGWKTLDVTALKDSDAPFSGEWALLFGNPNTNGTYCVVAGYGSATVPYLNVTYDNGSKVIYAASSTGKTACSVYYASMTTHLLECDVFYASDENTLVKI